MEYIPNANLSSFTEFVNSFEQILTQIETITSTLNEKQDFEKKLEGIQELHSLYDERQNQIINEMIISYELVYNDFNDQPFTPTMDDVKIETEELLKHVSNLKSDIKTPKIDYDKKVKELKERQNEYMKSQEKLSLLKEKYRKEKEKLTKGNVLIPRQFEDDIYAVLVGENGYLDCIVSDKENVNSMETDSDREAFWDMLYREFGKQTDN